MSFFVILPLISRETTLLNVPTQHHNLSYGFLKSTRRKRFRREKVLSGLLWVGLVFLPFIFQMMSSWWFLEFRFISLFSQFSMSRGGPWFTTDILLLNIQLWFSTTMATDLPILALLSALRFAFVRDVFRFQRGIIKKSRLVSIAILGEILPSAIGLLISLGFSPPFSSTLMYLPLPILPLIGFAFLRFSKFVSVKDELWSDYEHRMWYQKEQDPYMSESADESIKVPITYLLVSKVRKRLKE
jgi:hypothetical protein